MMTMAARLSHSLVILCLSSVAFSGRAKADDLTFAGTFAADNSTFSYMLNNTSIQSYNFFTTSYGGGLNADGTTTSAGGFVPVLTLFDSTGSVVDFGGAGGACSGGSNADPTTGLCDDAKFSDVLAPGTYDLVLSEFPNVASGDTSAPFLFGGDPSITGESCNSPGGTFLETDTAPCVQRTDAYTVNIESASPVPEPATWLLVLPAALGLVVLGRHQAA
jgi:hypothetical protein